jgi:hypothetical protein
MKAQERLEDYRRKARKRHLRVAIWIVVAFGAIVIGRAILGGILFWRSLPRDPVFTAPGTYEIASDVSLKVSIDETGEFVVNLLERGETVVSAEVGSRYHLWYFQIDASERVWIWSSDVGPYLIQRDHGEWKVSRTPALEDAPAEFIRYLPEFDRARITKETNESD